MGSLNLELVFREGDKEKPRRVPEFDPQTLQDLILSKGINYFELVVANEFKVELPVEDDAFFLVQGYNELKEFTEGSTDGGSHDVFLGDGALEIEAYLDNNGVKVKITYTPYLDARFSEFREFNISVAAYIQGWTRLINKLILASA